MTDKDVHRWILDSSRKYTDARLTEIKSDLTTHLGEHAKEQMVKPALKFKAQLACLIIGGAITLFFFYMRLPPPMSVVTGAVPTSAEYILEFVRKL